jgi:hypothetical protein
MILTTTLSDAQLRASRIAELARMTLANNIRMHQSMYKLLWDAQDPQQVMDIIGSDGVRFFMSAGALVDFILAADPNALSAAQYAPKMTVTPNADGTITLTPIVV